VLHYVGRWSSRFEDDLGMHCLLWLEYLLLLKLYVQICCDVNERSLTLISHEICAYNLQLGLRLLLF